MRFGVPRRTTGNRTPRRHRHGNLEHDAAGAGGAAWPANGETITSSGGRNAMAYHVEVNGVPMWYDERGGGDPLILLHGGLTDSRDFTGNFDALAGRFRLLLPERRGHGHTADVPGPITVEAMAQDTIAFVEKIVGGPVRLAGYSVGAIVALSVAVRRPDLVDRLVLISGAFQHNGVILRPTADAAPPAPLLAAYAEVSPDRKSTRLNSSH